MKSEVKVMTFRLGKAGDTAVNWESWQTNEVFIAYDRHGKACLLTPRHTVWAEYDPRRDKDGSLYTCEDYYMEVK